MTTRQAKSMAYEASLLLLEALEMLTRCAACRIIGHREPLHLQLMSHGSIQVCSRCHSTVD